MFYNNGWLGLLLSKVERYEERFISWTPKITISNKCGKYFFVQTKMM